jgi:hypothetical protein
MNIPKFGIDGTNEKIHLGKLMGKDFVIASGMLHYNSGLTFDRLDKDFIITSF